MSEDELQRDSKQSETIRQHFGIHLLRYSSSSSCLQFGTCRIRSGRIWNPGKPAALELLELLMKNRYLTNQWWKTAVDPVSGRTYFYDTVTRRRNGKGTLRMRFRGSSNACLSAGRCLGYDGGLKVVAEAWLSCSFITCSTEFFS
jgi:hypothetical protein